jgi:hypothetical protein
MSTDNKPHLISKKIDKLVKKGRMQAIVKEVAGRRVLVGFERNKRSRKSGVKFFTPAPIDLSSFKKGL